MFFFFSSRRRHTRFKCDWSSDVCSSDLELLVKRLRAEGYHAETCDDGIEGLAVAETGGFELAIVDVMLPGMDGIALTTALRAGGSDLPVLMLTARDTVDDRLTGLRAGADDYLVKPFAFAELV